MERSTTATEIKDKGYLHDLVVVVDQREIKCHIGF